VSTYAQFLAQRAHTGSGDGFEPEQTPEYLFPFQRDLVEWATHMGRGALFADCGLGKTPMQLAWAENVRRHTGRPVLVVTPLAVSFQTEQEAAKFGIDAAVSRDGRLAAGITITNYERLEHFTPDRFAGVVCDESSAIKAFDGQRRALVTEFLRTVPYRLLATATAAPNDYIELGTTSEALGQLGHMDMLGRFFTNKQRSSATGRGYLGQKAEWRFKGHAEQPFWRWVASWARAMRKPSDLGYDDTGFQLPPLEHRLHVVHTQTRRDESALFDVPAHGLHEQRQEARASIPERCENAADVLADAPSAVAWCHLNDESALLAKLIDGAVELAGSDSPDEKEAKLLGFSRGEYRVLVTKPSIGAWGLNWQHCHRMTFFPSHSYEQYYQAVRRSWRFGQRHPVTVDVITTEGGADILANLERKAARAERMFEALVAHMRDGMTITPGATYDQKTQVPTWLS
jgi:hypothetical protein